MLAGLGIRFRKGNKMNTYTFAEIYEGMSESFSKKVTVEAEEAFRRISGDDNPLHRDNNYAREIGGYKQHVSFGMLTASLYSTIAGMYLPGKYSLIHSLGIKFLKPVFVGDILTVTGTVAGKQDELKLLGLKVKIVNQNDECVSKADMKVLVLR